MEKGFRRSLSMRRGWRLRVEEGRKDPERGVYVRGLERTWNLDFSWKRTSPSTSSERAWPVSEKVSEECPGLEDVRREEMGMERVLRFEGKEVRRAGTYRARSC